LNVLICDRTVTNVFALYNNKLLYTSYLQQSDVITAVWHQPSIKRTMME